ncbi:unnamed protein product [Ectocarpus sp. 4 AP-2014]
MLSGLRRTGARRGMMAFLGSTGVPSSSSTPKASSRWVSTAVMSASAQSVVSDGPSLSVSKRKESVAHDAYDVVEEDFVAEYGATTTLYKHKKSGAEVLSVQIDDDNKVFGVTFRTPPEDSTGVPHILEHSVLCGSRNYPVKEPFVDLLKGSLQTFLNAFTYPDRTCYPVASQNLKDFYNLANVYLDAVFYPRAVSDPQVMEQEGWHYELEDTSDPLTYKGVVFNEMKGVYSSPDSLHGRTCQQTIFPDNAYGVDSGGDPTAIPSLTFEYFKGFHQRFYHPGNSRVYFYGDDPPLKRLELLDGYLSDFDASGADTSGSQVQWQKKKTEPWRVTEEFPAGEDSKGKHMVSVNWLLNDEPLSVKDALALELTDDLLVGTSAATLRKALTDSGLGESVIGGGLSSELLQNTYSIGLKGVSKEDVPKVEALVLETLEKIADDGFDQEAIDASINSVEFNLREFNTGSFPRGLSFMLGAMSDWVYNRNPTESLHFEGPLKELKDDLASGKKVFEGIVKNMLVNNGHRATVESVPNTELEAAIDGKEKGKLDEVKKSMSEQDLLNVIESTKLLKEAQAKEDSPEAKASLPTLAVSDLEREIKSIPIAVDSVQGIDVITHDLPSSGILYADVGVDLSNIPLEDMPILGIFSRVMMETGTSEMDRVQLSRRIGSQTGGVYATFLADQPSAGGAVADPGALKQYLFLRGKAVADKVPDMLSIMFDVMTDANLDSQQRVVEMLKESKARLASSIQGSGHSFANTRLEARYTVDGYLGELQGGVTYVNTVKDMLDEAENDWPKMLKRLQRVRATLLSKKQFLVNLTGDKSVLDGSSEAVSEFLSRLPEETEGAATNTAPLAEQVKLLQEKDEGFVVPTQVNYVVKGGPLYKPGEVVPGQASVVSRFLRTGYLWDTVRVMGGAYGGFTKFSPVSGLFSCLSYRDPNLGKTLDNYDGCSAYLTGLDLPQEELDSSIIGAIGDMDGPMPADSKGWTSLRRHLMGHTDEARQRFRNEVLDTKLDDFVEFGKRLEGLKSTASIAVVGSKAAFETFNEAASDDGKIEVIDPFAQE